MGIECNQDLCVGCLTCVVACMSQRYDAGDKDAVPPRLYENAGGTVFDQYISRSCRHCADAACVAACPSEALIQGDRGLVLVREERCVGCRQCAVACPNDVPRFSPEGKLVKCDGCAVRLECGLEAVCVSACPTGALGTDQSRITR